MGEACTRQLNRRVGHSTKKKKKGKKRGEKKEKKEEERKREKKRREKLLNTAWKDQFYTVRSEKNVAEIVLVVFR